ncbi:hypothetical protein PHET_00132 [Paragonimus heterotremus]|uniref:Uncharacterized protein n=1 Tax=Paragonimus heterotremus TaxID=100268 RepID=A0A8J4WVF2_9TREM|nr:hypothetical protein PHET_00132 [Paragonimus heterotremus]
MERELVVAENHSVLLRCETVGAPKAIVEWMKNGYSLFSSNRPPKTHAQQANFRITNEGNLLIERVQILDAGFYGCSATNQFGTSKANGRLFVRKRTRILTGPKLIKNEQDQDGAQSSGEEDIVISNKNSENSSDRRLKTAYVLEGTSIRIQCEATTDPLEITHLRMFWEKDAQILEKNAHSLNSRIIISLDGSSLRLSSVSPTDSGIYRCIAFTKLDNDSSSLRLIVRGKPAVSTHLNVRCVTNDHGIPIALLQWKPGLENNSPIEKRVVEMVAGAYRPPMPMLKEYTNSSGRVNGSVGLIERWTEDTLDTARDLAKKLIFINRWSKAHLLDDVMANSQLAEGSGNNTRQTGNSGGAAVTRIYADVVYHFRVRLENRIGLSDPSDIAPSLDAGIDSLCYLPPQPASVLPKEMIVYGNHPTNLIVKWSPIPPAEHNGPGLQYYLSITCLDCLLGPIKPLVNTTRITDWSVGELKVEQLITRESTGVPGELERARHWQVETFRTYEVSLTTMNLFGSKVSKPLTRTGQSGEGLPTITVDAPVVHHVGSQDVILKWKTPNLLELDQKIKGYFCGFRVEWCEASLSEKLCDFYKTHQNLIIRKPPSWSAAALRTSNDLIQSENVGFGSLIENSQLETHTEENALWKKDVNALPVKAKQAEIDLINNSYVARIVGLPGKTRLKLTVRVLNVQHAGAPSIPIYFETKEGVPEAVPEFIKTLVGVNHVEIAWVKPMRTNGVLTSYDLEVYEAPDQVNSKVQTAYHILHGSLIRQITVNDPEQLATRISGLKMNTDYVIYLWARTKAGRGQVASLHVRTAQMLQDSANPYFMISPIIDNHNSVNVCLARKLNEPVEHSKEFILDLNRKTPTESSATRLSNTESEELLSFQQNHPPTWQNEQHLSNVDTKAALKSVGPKHSDMFYAQFRKVGEENWEETQREFQKPWIVLSNLVSDNEYEIRVVIVKPMGQSAVSQSKFVRIPHQSGSMRWWGTPRGNALTYFSTYQYSTFLTGTACALILLFSTIVIIIFFVHRYKRRTSERRGHLAPSCRMAQSAEYPDEIQSNFFNFVNKTENLNDRLSQNADVSTVEYATSMNHLETVFPDQIYFTVTSPENPMCQSFTESNSNCFAETVNFVPFTDISHYGCSNNFDPAYSTFSRTLRP